MGNKVRIDIKRSERALLTDTLPFELPIFFTNVNLALLAHQRSAGSTDHELHSALLLTEGSRICVTQPYAFDIKKDNKSTRRLAIAHPRSQHAMSKFYGDYDQFITNSCSRSPYSLRYPSRVATCYIDSRYLSKSNEFSVQKNAADPDPVGFRDQSKWASTYFSYRDFSLIHGFFDSDEFTELEKTYSLLMKLDISRCFESIYTHTIEWTMRGKEFAKSHLPVGGRETFESNFDEVIRSANWNETHGIIIGPEFCRIFAEVILQAADRAISSKIEAKSTDVVIRRYVDDYFIFSNDERAAERAKEIIRTCLRDFNLHLNDAKTDVARRPFVSPISVVRSRIAGLIEDFFKVATPLMKAGANQPDSFTIDCARQATFKNIRHLAVEFDTPYESFSSHALSVMYRQLHDLEPGKDSKIDLTSGHAARSAWLTAILKIAQFLYATDERVTTSIKLARLYSTVIRVAEATDCALAPLENQMLDGLRASSRIREVSNADQVSRINHICSVDLLLKSGGRIEMRDVSEHLDVCDSTESMLKASPLQLIAALFIFRRRHRFLNLKRRVTEEIERRLRVAQIDFKQNTEAALLLTEYISCPYIDSHEKADLIAHCYKRITGANCERRRQGKSQSGAPGLVLLTGAPFLI